MVLLEIWFVPTECCHHAIQCYSETLAYRILPTGALDLGVASEGALQYQAMSNLVQGALSNILTL